MSELADASGALLAQLTKLVRGLSDDDIKRIGTGEARLTLLRQGQRVLDYTPAVDQAIRALQRLSPEELQQLEDRQAKVAVLRKGEKIISPLDPREVAANIANLQSEDEIIRLLDADTRLNPVALKRIAAELNIDIPATVKAKASLQLHIAQRALADRARWGWR